MSSYNELIEKINNLPRRIEPNNITKSNMVHSDGLTQTHERHHYGESVTSIRKEIWSGSLPLNEKIALTGALESHLTF